MDKQSRKALREEYDQRRPEMGIVGWRCGDRLWLAASTDMTADRNSTSFQLGLGTWPNRDLQQAYTAQPDAFEWVVLHRLDYKERTDNHDDDLRLLYDLALEEHPDAQRMRPSRFKL